MLKQVKILLLKPYLVAKTNGGEISMIERLKLLKSFGHEVEIHIALEAAIQPFVRPFLESMGTPLIQENRYFVDGLACHLYFDPEFHPNDLKAQSKMETFFEGLLDREQPDLVWAHYTDFFAVTSAVKWNVDRTWVMLTDNEYPRIVKLNDFPSIQGPYSKLKTFLVASRFMQNEAKGSFPWGKILFIQNPISDLEEKPVITYQPAVWLFVNPIAVKGVDFVIELAKMRSWDRFLFVGNWVNEAPKDLPPNISFVPRQKTLRNLWPVSRALLMPSVWDEAFGRIVLEAMAHGVPVIASDRGALPETVGMGGLSLPLEIPRWMDALSHSDDYFRQLSQKGYQRVSEYQRDLKRRYRALQRLLNRKN